MPIQLMLAARYLWGRKLRTFLTTLAVVFGVLIIFGMNILLPTMLSAFQTSLLSASGQVDLVVTSVTGEPFSTRILDRVEGVEGVKDATGLLERPLNIPADFYRGGSVGALALVGIQPRAASKLHDYTMAQGRFLNDGDGNAAVITSGLADTLHLKVGDELPIPTPQGVVRLKIVGIRSSQPVPGSEPVLVTLSEAQKLLGLAGHINTIEANLTPRDSAARDALSARVGALLGKDYQLGGLSSGSQMYASIQTAQQAFNVFGFLALFMGGFIIFNTFRTVVAERRHDIGMLRAIGASRRTVVGLFVTEGLLQGIVGTAVGMGLGFLMGVSLVRVIAGSIGQLLHVTIGAPVVEPWLIGLTLALGIGVTLLSGLIPALQASRVTPLEALRPSVVQVEKTGRIRKRTLVGIALMALAVASLLTHNAGLVAAGGLGFLAGLVLVAPVLVRPIALVFGNLFAVLFARDGTGSLAQGNLTRQPSRAAITASATMIGLAVIVAGVGLTSSIFGNITEILNKSLGSDYLLVPPSVGLWGSDVGADDTLADRLRAVYGVQAVSTLRFATSKLNDRDVNVLGIDPVDFPAVSGLDFQAGDPDTSYQALGQGRTTILNGIAASQFGIKVGDTVRLASPEGEQPYRVIAIASDAINTKILTAYISQANLKRDFHKTEDVFLQIKLAAGANRAQVDERLKEIVARYPQFQLISGAAYLAEIQQLYNASFVMIFVLLGVLALPSLIAILNTLAIGVIERTREIGMLRAIGATRKQVSRTILAEALLLAAIGTALGLLAGLYLGYVYVLGISASGIMQVQYTFPYAGVLVAIALGLIFGVVAALIPARQAARMDILGALRYE